MCKRVTRRKLVFLHSSTPPSAITLPPIPNHEQSHTPNPHPTPPSPSAPTSPPRYEPPPGKPSSSSPSSLATAAEESENAAIDRWFGSVLLWEVSLLSEGRRRWFWSSATTDMGDVGVIKCRLDADAVRGGIELRSLWALVAVAVVVAVVVRLWIGDEPCWLPAAVVGVRLDCRTIGSRSGVTTECDRQSNLRRTPHLHPPYFIATICTSFPVAFSNGRTIANSSGIQTPPSLWIPPKGNGRVLLDYDKQQSTSSLWYLLSNLVCGAYYGQRSRRYAFEWNCERRDEQRKRPLRWVE